MDERSTDDATGGQTSARASAADELPVGVRVAAAWSWRLIIIGIAVAALAWLIVQVRIIVIPLLVSILLTALLTPVVDWCRRRGAPRWLGVIAAILLLLAALTGLVMLIVSQTRESYDGVVARSQEQWEVFLSWLDTNPIGVEPAWVDEAVARGLDVLNANQNKLWSGALGIASTAGQLVTGTLLTLFSLIFMLIDGRRIWMWVLGFLPAKAHAPLDAAGRAGWVSVGQYVRVQIFVAFVDAIGIGVGAAILGVPLPVPIAILVFLGSFIPFLGAIATGALAVFVALVYNGPVNALVMLGIVILVNQVESHVLQPLVMGSAVRVHPLGVVLAVSTGALIAGVPGALFAVPLVAAANSIVNVIAEQRWDDGDPVAEFLHNDKTHRRVRHRARIVSRLRRWEGPSS